MPRGGVPGTKQSADERVRLAVAFLFDQKQDSGGPASGNTFALQPPRDAHMESPSRHLASAYILPVPVLSLF